LGAIQIKSKNNDLRDEEIGEEGSATLFKLDPSEGCFHKVPGKDILERLPKPVNEGGTRAQRIRFPEDVEVYER
jgi:hypothetical protein